MKTHPAQRNFVQGELSPLMGGRSDLDMYQAGLVTLVNMYTDARGPTKTREGMKYMTQYAGSKCRIETFFRTKTTFFTLIFLDSIVHIIQDIDNPVTTSFVTPWTADQLVDLQFSHFPVNKTVYVFHPNVQTQKIILPNPWDISTVDFIQNFDVSGEESSCSAFFFRADGLKMYTTGVTDDDVNEYDLGTAWDISTLVFLQSFDVSGEELDPSGLFFSANGLKMYVLGNTGNDVNEYNLGTAWDISSAVYFQNFDVSGEELTPLGLFFSPDGSKMYTCGTVSQNVNEYNLGTAWDVTSSVFLQSFDVSGEGFGSRGIFFRPDGLKMYVKDTSGTQDLSEYNLSVPWDISTAVLFQSVPHTPGLELGVSFSPDGTRMYLISIGTVEEFSLLPRIEAVVFTARPVYWGAANWPGTGVKYQGRLWMGGAPENPEEFFGSRSDFPEDLTLGAAADDAIQHSIDEVGLIEWLRVINKSLVAGTSKNEHVIRADSGLLKPGDIEVDIHSSYGSAHIQPPVIGDQLIYANISGRKIRAINYEWQKDNWSSSDLTFPSEHITEGIVKEIIWCQDPNNLLWVILGDGTLCCMTYERGANVYGWHRHNTQGTVLSAAAGSNGQRDILILAVLRQGEIYIEYLTFDYVLDSYKETDTITSSGGLFYVEGFDHLEGLTVQIISNGSVHPTRVVGNESSPGAGDGATGRVYLKADADNVVIGLGYTQEMEPLPLDDGAPTGSSMSHKKRRNNVFVKVLNSGPPLINGNRYKDVDAESPMDSPPALMSKDLKVPSLGWDREAGVNIKQDLPMPLIVLAVYGEVAKNAL